MPYPNLITLSEIETKVLNLLGYSAMTSARKRMEPIVRTHIQMAQDSLLEEFRDELTRVINADDPGATVVGETLYDVPDRCDPQEVKRFRVQVSDYWRNLVQGIDTEERNWERPPGWPVRWDVRRGTNGRPQLEIWPEPDAIYPLELEYWETPDTFEEDNDQCSIDSWLIVLMATANLKNHYRHADAEGYATQLRLRLNQIKGKQHGNKVYKRKFRNDRVTPWSQSQYDESTHTGRVILYDD